MFASDNRHPDWVAPASEGVALAAALWWLVLLCSATAVVAASGDVGRAALSKAPTSLALVDLNGKAIDPFRATTNARALVFVFMGVDCPIANRYAPELRRLHEKFAKQLVDWWLVYPGEEVSAETIRKRVGEFGHPGRIIRDPKLLLVRKAQARVTPEAAIFRPDGRLIYHGRIDDRHPELGVTRPTPGRRDLELALEAFLANRAVSQPSAKAVGCLIEGLP